jgi:hypothetical protein
MFLARLVNFQMHESPTAVEGILLCNGHANPNVQPVMDAWLAEQARAHQRDIRFMHLDDLGRWIMRDRLVAEFRAALEELDISIV